MPITLDAAAWRGGQVIGTDDRIYLSDGTRWKGIPFAEEAVSLARQNFTITVGAGGDFPTIGDALDYMNAFVPSQSADQLQGTVRILAGYVAAEQIILRQANLGWVRIIADDATVVVDESAITEPATTGNIFPFMEFVGNGPVIGCYFESDQSRTASQQTIGCLARAGYFATTPVLPGQDVAALPACGFGRFSINLSIRLGAAARLSDVSKFIDGRITNVEVIQASITTASGIYTGAGVNGLRLREQSYAYVNAGQAGASNSPAPNWRNNGVSDSSNDMMVESQSCLTVQTTTALGGTSIPARAVLDGSFVQDARVTAPQTFPGIVAPISYTVATVPSAAAFPAHMIHVSNGDSGAPCLAVSNGTNWLRIPLGAAVST